MEHVAELAERIRAISVEALLTLQISRIPTAPPVRDAADVDDSRRRIAFECRQEQMREHKWREMVHREGGLESVFREHAVVPEDARVVDEEVERREAFLDVSGQRAHLLEG